MVLLSSRAYGRSNRFVTVDRKRDRTAGCRLLPAPTRDASGPRKSDGVQLYVFSSMYRLSRILQPRYVLVSSQKHGWLHMTVWRATLSNGC